MHGRLVSRRWVLALVVTLLLALGGLAYASIPDAGGVIRR
jgi:hypothetical protein